MILDKLLRVWNSKPVVYGEGFFRDAWFKDWEELSKVLGALLESQPTWKSILDFGCGPGVMIDFLNDRNVHCVGCDYSAEARALYLSRYGKYPAQYVDQLSKIEGVPFDLLMAFDVLEHMRDDEIARLVGQVRHIPEFLFNISRARRIPGHINLKSDRAWISFIAGLGYAFEEERTAALRNLYVRLRPGAGDQWNKNLFLFRRIEP